MTAINNAIAYLKAGYNSMPVEVLNMLAIAGVPDVLGIITGAVVARMSLQFIKRVALLGELTMMTLFTGNPGAGKTASMVDLVMRELENRPVFVHFDEADRIRPEQVLLAESLKIPHTRCNARTWFDEVPDGAVPLIDEAQAFQAAWIGVGSA